jgi:hypothetical protein
MNSPIQESPQASLAKELRSILLSVKMTGTVFALLACCYCFAGLYEASGAKYDTLKHLDVMVIGGKSWMTDLSLLALFSHWPVFIAGVSLSGLALAYVWLRARRVPAAFYALCVAIVFPIVAGMILHTGARDAYDALLLQTRSYLEARNLL